MLYNYPFLFQCWKSKLQVLFWFFRERISDRKKCLNSQLSGNGMQLNCLKSKLVWISDIHCMYVIIFDVFSLLCIIFSSVKTGKSGRKLECPFCLDKFATKFGLSDHVIKAHEQKNAKVPQFNGHNYIWKKLISFHKCNP